MQFTRRLDPEERRRAIDEPGKSWRRWAREDLARYWYMILCLFVDLLMNLQFDEAYSEYRGTTNLILVIVSAVVLIPLAYVEYMIYRKLFPERF